MVEKFNMYSNGECLPGILARLQVEQGQWGEGGEQGEARLLH